MENGAKKKNQQESTRASLPHLFWRQFEQAIDLPVPFFTAINPFAPGDFAEKRVLKLVEWFSGHCRAIKS